MIHKRGDSFLKAVVTPTKKPDGYFLDHDLPTCQIRAPNGALKIQVNTRWLIPDTTRVLLLEFEEGISTDWPLGRYAIDVMFRRTVDGFTRHTSKAYIDVVDVVTKPLNVVTL